MSVAVHYSTAEPRFRLMSACVDKHSVGRFTFCRCAHPPRLCDTGVFSDVCQHGKSYTHRCLALHEDTENIIVVKVVEVAGGASFINGTRFAFR